jgi:hypothetical protein
MQKIVSRDKVSRCKLDISPSPDSKGDGFDSRLYPLFRMPIACIWLHTIRRDKTILETDESLTEKFINYRKKMVMQPEGYIYYAGGLTCPCTRCQMLNNRTCFA